MSKRLEPPVGLTFTTRWAHWVVRAGPYVSTYGELYVLADQLRKIGKVGPRRRGVVWQLSSLEDRRAMSERLEPPAGLAFISRAAWGGSESHWAVVAGPYLSTCGDLYVLADQTKKVGISGRRRRGAVWHLSALEDRCPHCGVLDQLVVDSVENSTGVFWNGRAFRCRRCRAVVDGRPW